MNPKTKCAVWVSDNVIEDEKDAHGKLLPLKHKNILKKSKSKVLKSGQKSNHFYEKKKRKYPKS